MAAWSTTGTIRGSQGLLAPLVAQGPDETKRRAPRCSTAVREASRLVVAGTASCFAASRGVRVAITCVACS